MSPAKNCPLENIQPTIHAFETEEIPVQVYNPYFYPDQEQQTQSHQLIFETIEVPNQNSFLNHVNDNATNELQFPAESFPMNQLVLRTPQKVEKSFEKSESEESPVYPAVTSSHESSTSTIGELEKTMEELDITHSVLILR